MSGLFAFLYGRRFMIVFLSKVGFPCVLFATLGTVFVALADVGYLALSLWFSFAILLRSVFACVFRHTCIHHNDHIHTYIQELTVR